MSQASWTARRLYQIPLDKISYTKVVYCSTFIKYDHYKWIGVGNMNQELVALVPGSIWLCSYPVHYSGIDFFARMSVLRLSDGSVMLHSPCNIDQSLQQKIAAIGEVRYIVAPGSYHYFHVASAQTAFPEAETYICPGIEHKQSQMNFDWFLGDRPPAVWANEFEQVLIRGCRFMWEVAFFHKPTKTLLLVDLIENIGDQTKYVGTGIKFWWKLVFRMWNKARPAPEYQMGWRDKAAVKAALERILVWDFERIVIAHGDVIEGDAKRDAKAVAREAWSRPLSYGA